MHFITWHLYKRGMVNTGKLFEPPTYPTNHIASGGNPTNHIASGGIPTNHSIAETKPTNQMAAFKLAPADKQVKIEDDSVLSHSIEESGEHSGHSQLVG